MGGGGGGGMFTMVAGFDVLCLDVSPLEAVEGLNLCRGRGSCLQQKSRFVVIVLVLVTQLKAKVQNFKNLLFRS